MERLRKVIKGDTFFDVIVYAILLIFFIIVLYPLIYVISASFSDADAVAAGKIVLLPVGFTIDGYKFTFQNPEIWIGYGNSLFYTVFGTILNLVVTLPCAYALSRSHIAGKGIIMTFFMTTMYIGGGLIPSYLNVRSLGLLDTRTFMLLHGAVSVYNLIVARTFFANSIPVEITEAAELDGCDDFRTFIQIVMPLSKALSSVMVLYYGVARWNSYFDAMVYLDDRNKKPLQLFLRKILIQGNLIKDLANSDSLSPAQLEEMQELAKAAELVKYSVIVVAAVPMMILYPRLQKYFEKGVMLGSVKG